MIEKSIINEQKDLYRMMNKLKQMFIVNNRYYSTKRNELLSKITGISINKSVSIHFSDINNSNYKFLLICKTKEDKQIKIEIKFEDSYDLRKLQAICYTSKIIKDCYLKNESLKIKKDLDFLQIRFTTFNIFSDKHIIHDFLFWEEFDINSNYFSKTIFIEIPKIIKRLKHLSTMKNDLEQKEYSLVKA